MFYTDIGFRAFENAVTDSHHAKFDLGVPGAFLKKIHQELNTLKIHESILSRMMKISKETIGVHIRKTDFLNKRRQLDYTWFEEKMREEIRKNNNVSFFLATDCNVTKQKMIDTFGERIMCYSFDFDVNRNNFLGQR